MYWCNTFKHRVIILFVSLSASFTGCKPELKQGSGALKYFDIKKYFNAEAQRLTKQNQYILKTAAYNGQQQTKRIRIANWSRELALFTESDINKASWKDSYLATKTADSVVYTAIDTTLHTRRLTVQLLGNKLVAVKVLNFTKNMLYQTREQLSYYPDSIYTINKHQSIVLLGAKNYLVSGKFSNQK